MSKYKRPNYEYWKNFDLWKLREAVYIIHGIEPPRRPSCHIEAVQERLKNRKTKKNDEIKKILYLARQSIKSGNLKGSEDSIKPADFIKWANSKNLKVPEELKDILDITTENEFSEAPYHNRKHENYSCELHAAVSIWLEICNKNKFRKKSSPKHQILELLKNRFPNFSTEAKNRIASIVNPDKHKKGGAPPSTT